MVEENHKSDVHADIERVLISRDAIQNRVKELAAEISSDYRNKDDILIVGVLKGSFIFLADVARELSIAHTVDFIAVSAYGMSATASGAVRIIMDVRQSVEGKHVILIEDIVDTGLTLDYLQKTFKSRKAASLKTCMLLDKTPRRQVEVTADYTGFKIPDVWVVGYGLDYAERHRTLPYIGELKKTVYSS